jgi:hypothetical protein
MKGATMNGTKNKLSDLNDHLFAQLERLSDESMTPEKIDQEAKRGKAIVAVADQIVKNASLQVQAAKLISDKGAIRPILPSVLGELVETPRPKLIEAKTQ